MARSAALLLILYVLNRSPSVLMIFCRLADLVRRGRRDQRVRHVGHEVPGQVARFAVGVVLADHRYDVGPRGRWGRDLRVSGNERPVARADDTETDAGRAHQAGRRQDARSRSRCRECGNGGDEQHAAADREQAADDRLPLHVAGGIDVVDRVVAAVGVAIPGLHVLIGGWVGVGADEPAPDRGRSSGCAGRSSP